MNGNTSRPREHLRAAEGCRTPGRCRVLGRPTRHAKRPGVRRPSAALGSRLSCSVLLAFIIFGFSFCASAQGVRFGAAGLVVGGNVVKIPETARPPAPEPKGDVVEFVDGSMLHGQ